LALRPIGGHDEPRRQFSEFIALAVIRALNRATNRDFAPSRMTFAHPRNSGLREIHRILRCPVEFAQTTDSWVLPQRVMELPIASGDSHLLHILEAHADDLLSERRTATGLRGMVENRLLSILPSGKAKTAVIAHQCGMSARSFTRHLAQEGTSFGEVLDRLRHRLALRYLEDPHISLQQIAWLLGYSEIGAFNHAFKRWTGTSPGRARDLPALPASA
jgi:AraC-like DNA-binding protein